MDLLKPPGGPAAVSASLGLDRAAVNTYNASVAPLNSDDDLSTPSDDDSDDDNHGTSSRLLRKPKRRLVKLRDKVKSKTQETFSPTPVAVTSGSTSSPPAPHASSSSFSSSSSAPSPLPILSPSPPSTSREKGATRLFHSLPKRQGRPAPNVKDVLQNPLDAVRTSLHGDVGAKIAGSVDNAVVTHGADVGLVRAVERLEEVEDGEEDEEEDEEVVEEEDDRKAGDGGMRSRGSEKREAVLRIARLKKERQDAFARWTLDRHVRSVRQMPPRSVARPQREDFWGRERGAEGWGEYEHQLLRFYAERYLDYHIGDWSETPVTSKEAIQTCLERVLVSSSSYQTLLMNIRHLYRWDDFNKTAIYCCSYFFLVLVGQLGAGFILFLIYLVLQRRLNPPTLSDLRDNIKRSEDNEATALNITQLIEQHGAHGWLNAVIDKTGPMMMLQLQDVADAMEMIRSFYEWRDPGRTARVLGVFVTVLLVLAMCPLAVLVRGIQVGVGVMVFGVFPISSHYPHYRHLLSPVRWLFWGVATDATWAIARLRAEARLAIQNAQPSKSDRQQSVSHEDDTAGGNHTETSANHTQSIYVCSPHCTTKDPPDRLHHGHLLLTTKNCAFQTAIRKAILWRFEWKDVSAIWKNGRGGENGLEFEVMCDKDGEAGGLDEKGVRKGRKIFWIEGLRKRDVIFSQIVGYSGVEWKVDD